MLARNHFSCKAASPKNVPSNHSISLSYQELIVGVALRSSSMQIKKFFQARNVKKFRLKFFLQDFSHDGSSLLSSLKRN